MRLLRAAGFAAVAFVCSSTYSQSIPIQYNVLLVTVDTFRPDRLSAHGYSRATSPHLDALAGDGALFEQAISSSSWTSPGLLSVLTGQFAPTHGVDVRGKSLNTATPTLATELSRAGYAVPDILYLSSIPNLSGIGLQRSYEDRDQYLPEGDRVLFEALEAYRHTPFFIYYHYRNLHLPFAPSAPFDTLYAGDSLDDGFARQRADVVRKNVTIPMGSVQFEPGDSAWLDALYDGQIREMDETFVRPLVATLRHLGLYERTLVIVTADHGEELLEHGFVGHPSTSFKGSAYDELLRIPLIVTCSGLIPNGMRYSGQVQNVDVMPTVLDLLGLPIPESVQGRSLKPLFSGEPVTERPAFTETTPGGYQATPEMMKVRIRAMRTPSWKLIHTLGPETDKYELYDLVRDPKELQDVWDVQVEIGRAMRTELHRWVLDTRPPSVDTTEVLATQSHSGGLDILFPTDGDTLHYERDAKEVTVEWTGQAGVAYRIEYDVGEGAYDLSGVLDATGGSSRHGPFTAEMWNMLTLYNPFSFRVVGPEGVTSSWVTFRIQPYGEATLDGSGRVVPAALFVWGEAGILFEGLVAGGWEVLARVRQIPATDAFAWMLAAALVAGLLSPLARRIGPEKTWAWSLVIVYTLLVFATLGVMPEVWGALLKYTKGRIDYGGSVAVGIAGIVVIATMVRRGAKPVVYGGLICLAVAYAWLLFRLNTSPAERFHLAEYGLLSLLAFRAFRLDLGTGASCLLGWGLASVAGTIDETIQWILPNRVFEWKDIGLNALSSGLATGIIATVLASGKRQDA